MSDTNEIIDAWMGPDVREYNDDPHPMYTEDPWLIQPMLDRCEELGISWSVIGNNRKGWQTYVSWQTGPSGRHLMCGEGNGKTLSEALTKAIVAMIETSKGETDE